MPTRAKRPLAEADANALPTPVTSGDAKRRRQQSGVGKEEVGRQNVIRQPRNRAEFDRLWETALKHIASVELNSHSTPPPSETFDYDTKDNGKLRRFLLERDLPTDGSREELLFRLANSSIDYTTQNSTELQELLKARQVKLYAKGSKEDKLARLRLNDKIIWDTGNPDGNQYGMVEAGKRSITLLEEGGLTQPSPIFSDMSSGSISHALKKRLLPLTGDAKDKVARLEGYEKGFEEGKRSAQLGAARMRQIQERHALNRVASLEVDTEKAGQEYEKICALDDALLAEPRNRFQRAPTTLRNRLGLRRR